MKRKIAVLLVTLGVVMSIAVPVSAFQSLHTKPPIKAFTHGIGGS